MRHYAASRPQKPCALLSSPPPSFQRAVPKQHDNQMEKLNTKLNAIREELKALKKEMKVR